MTELVAGVDQVDASPTAAPPFADRERETAGPYIVATATDAPPAEFESLAAARAHGAAEANRKAEVIAVHILCAWRSWWYQQWPAYAGIGKVPGINYLMTSKDKSSPEGVIDQ